MGTARLREGRAAEAEEGHLLDPMLLAPPRPPCLGALPVSPSCLGSHAVGLSRAASWPGCRRLGNALPRPPRGSLLWRHSEPSSAELQDTLYLRPDHVPTAPGLFCASGDSPRSLVPWLFGPWGPWAAGRQKPRIGCSLPGRVGSHPRALPFPPSARRGPASRACSCPTPRLRAVTSASAVPLALGPQRPHTARLSGGTRCLSSARQALLHLYNQVFFLY